MKIDKRLLSEAQLAQLHLIGSVGLGFGVGILIVAQAWVLSQAINAIFLLDQTLAHVAPLLWGFATLALTRALMAWGRDALAQRTAILVKTELRQRLVQQIVRLGPAFTTGERTGELTNTLVEGVEALDAYFSQYLPQVVLAAMMPLTLFFFVLGQDRLSAGVLLLTAPLIPIFMVLIGDSADAMTKRQWRTLSYLSAHFLDTLQGLTTLKLFGRSREQLRAIAAISDEYRRTTLSVLRVAFLSALVLEMLATLSVAVIAVEIGLRLLYGRMDFPGALFVLILAPDFYMPLRMLGARFHAGMAGVAASQRIFAILDQSPPTTLEVAPAAQPVNLRRQAIQFQDVHVAYQDDQRPALRGVSFTIQPGERVAVVGPSGAGKSTLIQLLLRFVSPQSGQILVGEQDLAEIDAADWRQEIVWVPQRPALFNVSLADNIRLGRPHAAEADVMRAATQAGAVDFINALPQGFESVAGEQGVRLSGGQAQRIALARAFLLDAPFLLFDEATAHLDPATEAQVQTAIRTLAQDRTVLFIAHRLDTLALADRILVMDQGRIVQSGTQADLMADPTGLFYRLATTQTEAEDG
ncbi:MAG: thiol reductant ABC exporter subunit CydD [Caldilineaceae bacterium]|nr:thiol reductant ABC exporter subunit CydD [Caldilineaceae bacterium]MBP8107856.1 thiol reductant ABC exporter subunit CydD [Caldilineaceae bacterium]MBP8122956.1 thiol reductant ABC exporter subunit CydD [Caldilineaceae bacterium]MBP9073179.1 thiol reductant ABC exporter subunit CydD [Caldilineaceae bacterium]